MPMLLLLTEFARTVLAYCSVEWYVVLHPVLFIANYLKSMLIQKLPTRLARSEVFRGQNETKEMFEILWSFRTNLFPAPSDKIEISQIITSFV